MKAIRKLYQRLRIAFYHHACSDNRNISGRYRAKQPVLFAGKGKITFGEKVDLGFYPSPYFFSDYIHIEARSSSGSVRFGSGTKINNSCVFISDTASITIGNNCLIGTGVEIYDTDFHTLEPERRHIAPESKAVLIGDNVFIGSSAIVLKGVTIGTNSIVAAGAVVVQSIPPDSIVAGNPARLVKSLVTE